jgi:hypothetical protein
MFVSLLQSTGSNGALIFLIESESYDFFDEPLPAGRREQETSVS